MFVAVIPPAAVLAHLEEFVAPRRAADGPLRWADPQSWHVTLAFLPDVVTRRYDDLIDALGETAARSAGFGLRLAGAGAFPAADRAGLLWLGIEGEVSQLTRLSARARTAGARSGNRVDGGRFRPHLSLARAREPLDLTRWLRVFSLYEGPEWDVAEFHLLESRLGQGVAGRALHQRRQSFELVPTPGPDPDS
jgi:2'-5' RNA ligase